MNVYKIEEVAEKCGLTKRTIRYYEEIGLLFPPERSNGGFRLYSDQHIERLKQITSARDVLGISLMELQEFVTLSEEFNNQREDIRQMQDQAAKSAKLVEIEQMIGKQLRIVDQKLEKLAELRKDLSSLYDRVLEAKNRTISDQE